MREWCALRSLISLEFIYASICFSGGIQLKSESIANVNPPDWLFKPTKVRICPALKADRKAFG